MKKKIGALVSALIIGHCSHAQQPNSSTNKTNSYPEVEVISEKRLDGTGFSQQGRNVTVITQEMLQLMPVTSVQEALQYINGVDLRQRGPLGAQADLTMMGSTFEQVLLLVNGIPMRDPQTGHNQMNLPISLNQIERIEIMMGSASRIYGANAMAGAINIVTKIPTESSVFVQAFGGSNFKQDVALNETYYLAGGQATVGWRGKGNGHQLDMSFLETNGYRHNSQNSQQRINYTGNVDLAHGKLNVFTGTVFNDFGANNFYAAPNDKNATESVNTIYGGIKYERALGNWTLRPLIYSRYNHDDYIFIKQKPEVYRNNHFTTASGAELHTRYIHRLGALGLGFESRLEMINSNNLGKHQRYYYAFYADHRFDITSGIQLTIGGNAQYNNDYGWHFYPGGELNVRITPTFSSYINAGLANRLPTYTDLYYKDSGNIGNSNLQPESALNVEGGVKWRKEGWTAQGSGFIRESTNFIDFVKDSLFAPWQPQNFSTAQIQGLDLRAQYRWAKSSKFFSLQSLLAGITWLDASFQSGDMLSKYAMEHLTLQATANVSFTTSKHFTHTVATRYAERFNGAEFGLVDYRLRWNHTYFSAFVDITNIFDRKYIESGIIEMPGRWYRVGVEFYLHKKSNE